MKGCTPVERDVLEDAEGETPDVEWFEEEDSLTPEESAAASSLCERGALVHRDLSADVGVFDTTADGQLLIRILRALDVYEP